MRILVRIVAGIRKFFAWIGRQIRWVWTQASRVLKAVFHGPFEWFVRGLRSIKEKLEKAIDWLVDILRRIWSPGRTEPRINEERIGANAAPLLATLTLAAVWYLIPVARWMGYGPRRFIVGGIVIWLVALVAWLSRCREDRSGRVARFAQRIYRSAGLRRLDQLTLIPALVVCYLTLRETQLIPIASGSLVSVFALLTVEQQHRPGLAAPPTPPLDPSRDQTTSPSGQTQSQILRWRVMAHGEMQMHEAAVEIDVAALEIARAANPTSGAHEQIVDWVLHGVGPEVHSLAKQISEQCFASAYSLYAAVSCFAGASQAIVYTDDLESTGHEEYWRYPIETLADGKGDCEDSAILLAALLRRAGYRCAIVIAPGHAAVAVEVPNDTPGRYFEKDDVRYYYCETTGAGWRVGEVPDDVDIDQASFVPVPPWRSE